MDETIGITIVGEVRARIKCRAFSALRMTKLNERVKDFEVWRKGLPDYDCVENPYISELEEWTNTYVELNMLNPNFKIILHSFEKHKNDISELVEHFISISEKLKEDPSIPKVYMQVVGKGKVKVVDHTTLECAEKMLAYYQKELLFICECFSELETGVLDV